jgi:flagellin
MLRIGARSTGVDVTAQRQIQNAFQRLSESTLKLATLKRINRGSDDPAGLIAAMALHRDLTAVEEAAAAAERTRALVRVADSAMGQAGELLNDIHANVLAAVGDTASPEQKAALQLEVDAALEALDRIGSTTSFAGKKLFDGQPLEFLVGTEPTDLKTLNLPELNSASLGGESGMLSDLRSGGAASLDGGDSELAVEILDAARQEILAARAEAGAFERYAIDSTQEVLSQMSVDLSSALSHIADTDVALESANLVRSGILVDSALLTARLTHGARRMMVDLLSGLSS